MRFTFRVRAGEHEIFAYDAFDDQIGKVAPFNLKETEDGPPTRSLGEARLVGVNVVEGGKAADLTLETQITDEFAHAFTTEAFQTESVMMSFSFKDSK